MIRNKKLIIYFFLAIVLFSFNSSYGVESISVSASNKKVLLGDEVDLKVDILLKTANEILIISPPKLESLDGVEVKNVSVTSTSSNGQVIQSYHYRLKLNKTGEIKVNPIVITYKEIKDGSVNEIEAKGIVFSVYEYSLIKSAKARVFAAVIILLIFIIITVYILRERSVKRVTDHDAVDEVNRVKDILLKTKRASIEGDFVQFFTEAIKFKELLDERDDEYNNFLALFNKARYGSHKFLKEDIAVIYRTLEIKFKERYKENINDELSDIDLK